jgi:hypothetical protein
VKVLTQFGSHDSRAPSPTRPLSLTRPLDEKTRIDIASTRIPTQPVQSPTRLLNQRYRVATMSMKRKRSTGSLFQTPALEASTPSPFLSSPIRLPNFFVQSKTHEPQSSPFTLKSYHHETSQQGEHTSHTLNSRTRKRYRDARPDESQIHGMKRLPYFCSPWQHANTMQQHQQ